jgi:hypothetical protein
VFSQYENSEFGEPKEAKVTTLSLEYGKSPINQKEKGMAPEYSIFEEKRPKKKRHKKE